MKKKLCVVAGIMAALSVVGAVIFKLVSGKTEE